MSEIICKGCEGQRIIQCPICNGLGKVYSESRQKRETKQLGYTATLEDPKTTCHICQGCGDIPCPKCGGTGKEP